MKEIWKTVPGYQGYYEVSDQGNVRSLDRVVGHKLYGRQVLKGQPLRAGDTGDGHLKVSFSKDGIEKSYFVHRLVLETFVGPCPEGMEACHENGQPADNRLANLSWGTKSKNMRDIVRHGTHPQSKKTHCAQGHEYTEENTGRSQDGRRRWCRACHREWSAKRRK